jgi:hypothetical protein
MRNLFQVRKLRRGEPVSSPVIRPAIYRTGHRADFDMEQKKARPKMGLSHPNL